LYRDVIFEMAEEYKSIYNIFQGLGNKIFCQISQFNSFVIVIMNDLDQYIKSTQKDNESKVIFSQTKIFRLKLKYLELLLILIFYSKLGQWF